MIKYCPLPYIVKRELFFLEEKHYHDGDRLENDFLIALNSNGYFNNSLNDAYDDKIVTDEAAYANKNATQIQEEINMSIRPRLKWMYKRKLDDKTKECGLQNRKVIHTSEIDEPEKKKIRHSIENQHHFDNVLNYKSVIRSHVHCDNDNDANIANRLAHNAYCKKIKYCVAYPIIQRFVGKSIENSMSPRKCKSKIKLKEEKNIERKFILHLKGRQSVRENCYNNDYFHDQSDLLSSFDDDASNADHEYDFACTDSDSSSVSESEDYSVFNEGGKIK